MTTVGSYFDSKLKFVPFINLCCCRRDSQIEYLVMI